MMENIVNCSQCGKRFLAYDERNQNGYSDCRTHIRAFLLRNPQFYAKQKSDYSEYLTTKERRDLAMGIRVA